MLRAPSARTVVVARLAAEHPARVDREPGELRREEEHAVEPSLHLCTLENASRASSQSWRTLGAYLSTSFLRNCTPAFVLRTMSSRNLRVSAKNTVAAVSADPSRTFPAFAFARHHSANCAYAYAALMGRRSRCPSRYHDDSCRSDEIRTVLPPLLISRFIDGYVDLVVSRSARNRVLSPVCLVFIGGAYCTTTPRVVSRRRLYRRKPQSRNEAEKKKPRAPFGTRGLLCPHVLAVTSARIFSHL